MAETWDLHREKPATSDRPLCLSDRGDDDAYI